MYALYRKELKLRFGSIGTVITLLACLVIGGALTSLFHLTLASSDISYTLRALALPTACLLPIPILIAAKKNEHDGSDLWLRSLPIRAWSVPLSRLLASFTFLLSPATVLGLSPLFLSLFGEINFPVAYTAFFGYLLFSLYHTVFSHFIVSSCKRTWLRPLLCIGIPALLFLCDLFAGVFSLPEWLYRALIAINPFSLYEDFTHGRFSFSGTLCLFALTLVFLALLFVWEAKKSGWLAPLKKRRSATVALILSCAISLGATVTALLLPSTVASHDMRDTETFVVSGITKDALRALTQDVTVYYLCAGGEKSADPNLFAFLKNYDDESDLLQIRVIDTEQDTDFSALYTDAVLSDHSFIAVCDERCYVIDNTLLYHYYNADLEKSFSPSYYAYCLEAFEYYMTSNEIGSYDETAITYGSTLYYSTSTSAYFDGDAYLLNAIHYVTSPDLPTVYLFNGEKSAVDTTLTSFLTSSGYLLKDLASLKQIPSDCNLLLLYSPTKDLSEKERDELLRYTNAGGDLFLCSSCAYTDLPNLFSILSLYGLSTEESANIVCEQNTQNTEEYSYNFYASVSDLEATGDFEGSFALLMPHAITLKTVDGAAPLAWIHSSQNARLQLPDGTVQENSTARYTCGAVSSRESSRVVWISSALSLGLQGYTVTGGDNYRLAKEAMDWATETRYQPISVPSTVIPSQTLSITSGEAAIWAPVFTLLIPLAVTIPLAVRIYVRRKR